MSESFPIPFGRYELTERLAMGGMAELFLARVTGAHGFEKKVVIKRILPHLARDEHFTQLFISEAKITAQLSHPKIAQTYELDKVEGQLFIAMEYVDGLDVLAMLRECAHRKERLPTPLSVFIIAEVLDALDFAHKQADPEGNLLGIVHRDVSPSNILVSRRGDVKLVDFGIAHAMSGEQETQAGTLKGKYGYMSPEQVLGEDVTGQSDLFSVGVVLAEMLMGRRLFAAPNEIDVLIMVRDVDLGRLDRLGKEIEPGLDELIRKALRKDPSARFEDAGAFRDELEEWLFEHRHRIAPRQVADYVDKLYRDATRRRQEQLEKQQPPAEPQPEAEVAAAAEAGPANAGEEPLSESEIEAAVMEVMPPEPVDDVADSGGVPYGELKIGDSIPIYEAETAEEEERAAAPKESAKVRAPTVPAKPGQTSPRKAFSAEEAVPEAVDDELELSVRYPSISAAVASVKPPEPDPATREFDDSNIASEPEAASRSMKRRLPTLREIASSPKPPPPALEDISDTPSESGDLNETPTIRILFRLATSKATGLLVLSVGGIRKEVYFRDGVPEYVSSNVAGELFGAYLVGQGVISEGELDMALAMMPHYGGKLGDTLVGLGLVKPLEVFRLLTKQVRQKLIDVCSWENGLFAWYAERENPRESFRLDLDPLEVLGAGARALTQDSTDQWLQKVRDQRPRSSSNPAAIPDDFKISDIRSVYDLLDGRRTVGELARRYTDESDRRHFLQVLYLLIQTDLARFA